MAARVADDNVGSCSKAISVLTTSCCVDWEELEAEAVFLAAASEFRLWDFD